MSMGDKWEMTHAYLNWQASVRESYAPLIVESGGIVDANASGFTTNCGDGIRKIELAGGLQATDYIYYAPLLDDVGKATLALGVLKNRFRASPWIDFEIGWRHLMHKQGNRSEQDWLPALVEVHGFDAIASEMRQAITNFHQSNPRAFLQMPRWNGVLLVWRNNQWRFRNQAGPLRESLDALEKARWPRSVKVGRLDPDQIREVAKQLRRKTWPHICWHASNDGTLSWSAQ
jgi:hypothetical protein